MTATDRAGRRGRRARRLWLVRLAALAVIALGLRERFVERAALRSAEPPASGVVAALVEAQPRGLDRVPRAVAELGKADYDAELGVHWPIAQSASTAGALRLVTTSPAGDGIRGYSGATALALLFDPEGRCAGARIQWSDDTREHVALVEASGALDALRGLPPTALASVELDGTSGASLTARAIERALAARFGGEVRSVFQRAQREAWRQDVERWASERLGEEIRVRTTGGRRSANWTLETRDGVARGSAVLTSPSADSVIGYSGPTASALLFDSDQKLLGIRVLASFDSEPYVSYVRDDAAFGSRWRGARPEELAADRAPDGRGAHPGLDGVSGATMTSMAVLEAARVAASAASDPEAIGWVARAEWLRSAYTELRWTRADSVSAYALGVAVLALVLARRAPAHAGRRRKGLRTAAGAALVLGVGAFSGHLVSLAQIVGTAERGVAGSAMLLVLGALAAAGPLLRNRNHYCQDLCPHGIVQQWIRPRANRSRSLGTLRPTLAALPYVLLLGAPVWLAVRGSLDAAALEPFDAWSLGLAAPVSCAWAALGLAASRRVPMAYCRYGCPTGALLGSLSRSMPRTTARREGWLTAVFVVTAVVVQLA